MEPNPLDPAKEKERLRRKAYYAEHREEIAEKARARYHRKKAAGQPKCDRDCYNCKFPDCILTYGEAIGRDVSDDIAAALRANKPRRKYDAEYQHQYYLDHKQQSMDYQRAYRDKNREKVNARERGYYQANKEQRLAKSREYYRKNTEKCRAYQRDYAKKKREALKGGNPPEPRDLKTDQTTTTAL